VTFLFTDIEGSTRLWQEDPSAMRAAMARHDRLLRGAFEGHRGMVFSTMGDGMAAAFSAPSALCGCVRRLAHEPKRPMDM
jgi:class 3 adenylate cyclase